jgi:trehalose 6-phosphate synthase
LSDELRRSLIVVSNRGPVTYTRDATGTRVESRGAGGLVTALRGLVHHHDVTWIASAATDEDRVVAAEGSGDGVVLVAHDPVAYDGYYNTIANPLLWFVQHSLWGLGMRPELDEATHDAWHDGYVPVNQGFADAVVAQLDNTPDATVFFHDYHLYLAPAFVREVRPDARLAHFVHIPWPADWSTLPQEWRRAVHAGLLSNDVVGFHTERWGRNFLRSCDDVLGPGPRPRVAHHPIAVDPAEFEELATSDPVLEREAGLVATRTERLIVRVDRTDPSKNIVRGFHAFELLLERHPEWHGRVSMLALLDPSREQVPEYVAYRDETERAVRAVNDRFGRPGWQPVDLRIEDDFLQSVAAYKQYDVLLVNAVYDGMNLVAKEGPLVNTLDGVLVLSENTGAYDELGEWALGVSPFDVLGQAEALHAALSMDGAERRRRAEALRAHMRRNDAAGWLRDLLADVDAVGRLDVE